MQQLSFSIEKPAVLPPRLQPGLQGKARLGSTVRRRETLALGHDLGTSGAGEAQSPAPVKRGARPSLVASSKAGASSSELLCLAPGTRANEPLFRPHPAQPFPSSRLGALGSSRVRAHVRVSDHVCAGASRQCQCRGLCPPRTCGPQLTAAAQIRTGPLAPRRPRTRGARHLERGDLWIPVPGRCLALFLFPGFPLCSTRRGPRASPPRPVSRGEGGGFACNAAPAPAAPRWVFP